MTSDEYPNIDHVSSKLAKTNHLSKHNKEVLDDFFDRWRHRANERSNKDYANKWINFAPEIDFKIDEASRKDIEKLMKALDRDEIRSNQGDPYSPHTKKKHFKALSTFYNNFIDYPDRGYNKEINGHAIVDGQKELLSEQPQHGVKIETKPSASQVREIANTLDNLRDRAILVFGWSCGARVGEIFKTTQKPQPLLWKDIKFNNDSSMTVHLRKNYKKAKPNRRRIQVVVGKPLLEKLYRERNPDPEEPVFARDKPTLKCPKCSSGVQTLHDRSDEGRQPGSSWKREYECTDCLKVFKRSKIDTEKEGISGKRVNEIIGNAVENSEYRNMDKTTHKFFRKARALHKIANNWGDSSINGFFGWEPNSSARTHYMEALQVSQKKDLQEEHPELDINVEGRFYDDGLKPCKCSQCDKLNSRLWNLCIYCGTGLTYQGMEMKGDDENDVENDLKHRAKTSAINELSEKAGMEESEVQNLLKSKIEEELEEA